MDPNRKKYELYQKQKQLKTVQSCEQWVVKCNDRFYKMIQIPLSKQYHQSDNDNFRSLKHMESSLFKYTQLTHSHLGRVKDTFVYSQQQLKLVIIAGQDSGQDLGHFINVKAYNDLNLLKSTMIGLAEALAHLHQKNITHDNVCLQNVRRKKEKYLLVFNGFRQSKPYLNHQDLQAINQSYYSAPEKYYSKGYECSADVWSLGILFLEMILGERIQEMSSDLPCKIAQFPEHSIAGRLSNSSVRQVIHSMLIVDPQKRAKMPAVVRELRKLNFLTIDEYIPKPLAHSQNYYTFQIDLLEVNEVELEAIPSLNKYQQLDVSNSITSKANISFRLQAFSNEKRLRITAASTKKSRPFHLDVSFAYQHLEESIRQCFDNIEQFFDQIKSNLSKCLLKQDGILSMSFDRERCLALKEIREDSLKGAPKGSEGGQLNRKQSLNQFDDIVFFNSQDINNNHDISADIEAELPEFEKVFKKKRTDTFEGDVEIEEEQKDQDEWEWVKGRFDLSKSTLDDTINMQKVFKLVEQSQELFAQHRYKQALQKELQVYQLKAKYVQPDSHIMQTSYYKLANRYLVLEQYDNSIKYCILTVRAQKCQCSESIFMRKQAIRIIIQLYILVKSFQQEELNKWINILKKSFPKDWKELYLTALSHCLYMSQNSLQLFQFIFDKIVSTVDLSERLTSLHMAVSYTKIYREISLNSLSEYYDFSFELLAKAVGFFKKYPNNPLCQENLAIIIKGFQIRLYKADIYFISAQYIRKFIEEHMPEYKNQILAGYVDNQDHTHSAIQRYQMLLRQQ